MCYAIVTMMLASVVVITKFFGWAIPSQDHPVVFIGAFIMTVIGMDVVIRDVRKVGFWLIAAPALH